MALKQFNPGEVTAVIVEEADAAGQRHLNVNVTTTLPVDRQQVAGWGFKITDRQTAQRLVNCINANRAYRGYEIKKDVNQRTYVSTEQAAFLHGRHMKKSLTSLGF